MNCPFRASISSPWLKVVTSVDWSNLDDWFLFAQVGAIQHNPRHKLSPNNASRTLWRQGRLWYWVQKDHGELASANSQIPTQPLIHLLLAWDRARASICMGTGCVARVNPPQLYVLVSLVLNILFCLFGRKTVYVGQSCWIKRLLNNCLQTP